MLNFDRDRYVSIGKGALALRGRIEEITQAVTDKGYKNVYLIGSGGSYAMFIPFGYYLRTLSTIEAHTCIAAEVMAAGDNALGKDSVCIFTSTSGTTKETVAAAEYCREKGATTICISGREDVPFAQKADYAIINQMDDFSGSDADYFVLTMLTFSLMARRGEYPDYDALCKSLEAMPEALVSVKEQVDDKAKAYAAAHKDDDFTLYTGDGAVWGEAYMYAICVLCEMQWKKTMPVKGCEFFHGPLELLEDEKVHLVVLIGEDACRPLGLRVERFAKKYLKNYTVFDTADFTLPGVEDRFRGVLSNIVVGAALDRVSIHMEQATGHSLDIRKYYNQVEY